MVEKALKKDNLIMVPIPNKITKNVGLHAGSYVEVSDDGYHIILTPIDEEFTDEQWAKLRTLAKAKGKTYERFSDAQKHLQKLKK